MKKIIVLIIIVACLPLLVEAGEWNCNLTIRFECDKTLYMTAGKVDTVWIGMPGFKEPHGRKKAVWTKDAKKAMETYVDSLYKAKKLTKKQKKAIIADPIGVTIPGYWGIPKKTVNPKKGGVRRER